MLRIADDILVVGVEDDDIEHNNPLIKLSLMCRK